MNLASNFGIVSTLLWHSTNDGEQQRWDAGVNLILHEATNTKLTASYFNDDLQNVTNEGFLVGIQFAF